MPDYMNFAIEHVAVPATNPAALRDWYVQVLGARILWDNGRNPPACLVALPGGGWLEIYPAESRMAGTGNNKLAGWRHVALRVASLEVAKAELEKCGVKFDDDIQPAAGGGQVLFFEDAEGNLLHLIERPNDFKL